MSHTIKEVLNFVKENDVKFIHLGFCDLSGAQKNISIMAENLSAAFADGVSFDAHAIKGFREVTQSDLLLFPDPATLTVLPWRPGSGRVAHFYCHIKTPNGEPFALDGRHILKSVVEKYAKLGLMAMIGAECEFYLFKVDENGEPTTQTLDQGGYLDISPLDKGEDIRREICLTIEEMGIKPETSHHEQGPGQNEVDFKFSDALTSADNLMTFKSVVSSVAARNGLFASFAPKPIANAPGSGLHVNISLSQKGLNIFGEDSVIVESFIAGILSKAPEITLFLNPLASSYERLGRFEAPKYVSWGRQNRSQLVRIPAAKGDKTRMELRSPDPSINPYLAFALILGAGLFGIEKELPLPPAVDADLYTAGQEVTSKLAALPANLREAVEKARNSQFVKVIIGEELHLKYLAIKEAEDRANG
ncbi:MAG: glutamine synthetase family protein [Defluviitaleaceae bacterium]|nr:glutamine synthetase family protein [Defluviitaleaceae bacterium]